MDKFSKPFIISIVNACRFLVRKLFAVRSVIKQIIVIITVHSGVMSKWHAITPFNNSGSFYFPRKLTK